MGQEDKDNKAGPHLGDAGCSSGRASFPYNCKAGAHALQH